MPNCLLCNLWPVTADTQAGLCLSCRESVRRTWFYPVEDDDGLRLVWARVSPANPLGCEDPAGDWGTPYRPETLFPDGATTDELAAVRAELFDLACGPAVSHREPAHRLLARMEAAGVRVVWNMQHSRAEIANPRACPYTLLIEFVRLQLWIEDVLYLRERFRIRERNRNVKEKYREWAAPECSA